ncbi:LysR substrate-binding domain-containing protein [Kingella kingae]|uniref:LysR substrate-binding domain-containing protein n=1 Tax=Kingella kingae TaxID=504 RepID=UPI00295EB821|nr:LysR substrate-binding domain-containing protein [Kingella kingae]
MSVFTHSNILCFRCFFIAYFLQHTFQDTTNQFTWIEMSGISGSYKNLQQFWQRHKLSPKKQIICDYPQAIIDLCAAGTGLAIVPKHSAELAQAQGKPIAMIPEYEQSLPLSFIYFDEYSEDPALVLLRDHVTQVWQV